MHQDIVAKKTDSEDIEPDLFFKKQLNSPDQELFLQHLSDRDLKADEYIWIPVHPWQWENHLISILLKKF